MFNLLFFYILMFFYKKINSFVLFFVLYDFFDESFKGRNMFENSFYFVVSCMLFLVVRKLSFRARIGICDD